MSIQQYFQAHPELSSQHETARESFSKQGEKCSFTAFVLNQKIVNEEDYLIWAQTHYGLVILNNEYLQINNPDMALWSRWKNTYAWSNEFLPIGEWDGVLFIGCLEKPEDFNAPHPVCFALCSPLHLKNWNKQYESEEKVLFVSPAPSTPKIPSMSEVPTSDKILTLELQHDSDSSIDNDSINSDESFENSPADEKVPNENSFLMSLESLTPPTENSFLLNIDTLKPQLVKTESSPVSISIEDVVPNIEVVPNGEATPPKIPKLEPVKLESLNFEVKKPEPPKVAVATAPKIAVATAPTNLTPIKAQPKNSVPFQADKNSPLFLTKLFGLHKNLGAELKALCEPLIANYEKYLILSVDDELSEARPLVWSESFNPGIQNYGISLKSPSIFYIVAATSKPFHGPVSPNDQNDKFFDDWNMSHTPGHATLVPILHKDQLIGILLALGEATAFNNHILRSAVKVGSEITQNIYSKEQKSAA